MSTNLIEHAYFVQGINYDFAVELIINDYAMLVYSDCTKIWYKNNNSVIISTLLNYTQEELFQESCLPMYNIIDINLVFEIQKLCIEYIKNYDNSNTIFSPYKINELEGKTIEIN